MSLSDLAAIGSFVSGIAVLVSLVYLAVQVGQAERNQRALMQQTRADRVCEVQLRLATSDLASVFGRATAGEDVTIDELRQFRHAFRAQLASTEDSFFQHRQRLLAEDTFEGVTLSVASLMARPGSRAMWTLIRPLYGAAFRAYVDSIVADARSHAPDDELTAWKAALGAEQAGA